MPGSTIDLRVVGDAGALAEQSAAQFARAVRETLKTRSYVSLVLCGGETPIGLYERLTRPPYDKGLPWPAIHVFWGDERFVPHGHPYSNYRAARRALLDHVPFTAANIHPVGTEGLTLEESAQNYERILHGVLGDVRLPAFDLTLLGMGNDGHTASLFSGLPALEEEVKWVSAVRNAPKPPPERITLTLPALKSSRRIILLTTGAEKSIVLSEALSPAGRDSPLRRLLNPTTKGTTGNSITVFSCPA